MTRRAVQLLQLHPLIFLAGSSKLEMLKPGEPSQSIWSFPAGDVHPQSFVTQFVTVQYAVIWE